MGILMAFAVGYVVGARAGSQDFEDVVASLRAVRDSDEFSDLLSALRTHLGHAMHEMGDLLERTGGEGIDAADLVERVKRLARRD
jgi:hypothetical protein